LHPVPEAAILGRPFQFEPPQQPLDEGRFAFSSNRDLTRGTETEAVATAAIANGSLHLFSFSFIFAWHLLARHIFAWQGPESLFACFSLCAGRQSRTPLGLRDSDRRSVLVKEAKPALLIGREHTSKLTHLIFRRFSKDDSLYEFFNRCRLPVGWLRPARAELAGRAYQPGRAESGWMMASAG
jgi:hypothetical protein